MGAPICPILKLKLALRRRSQDPADATAAREVPVQNTFVVAFRAWDRRLARDRSNCKVVGDGGDGGDGGGGWWWVWVQGVFVGRRRMIGFIAFSGEGQLMILSKKRADEEFVHAFI